MGLENRPDTETTLGHGRGCGEKKPVIKGTYFYDTACLRGRATFIFRERLLPSAQENALAFVTRGAQSLSNAEDQNHLHPRPGQ